jgi:hypothetical protein
LFSRGKKDREKKRRKQERREKVAICFRERGGENKDLGIPPPPQKKENYTGVLRCIQYVEGLNSNLVQRKEPEVRGGTAVICGGGRVT